MSYDSDAFIKNIIEHSERITAIIENTDFSNHSLNPNLILIPSLWNNVNDALVAWALLINPYESDCRKNPESVLRQKEVLTDDAEKWLNTMKSLRTVYISDIPEMEFNQNDCMSFLTAYDNFMYFFCRACYNVQHELEVMNKNYKCICSMRETFLKNISGETSEKIQLVKEKPAKSPQISQIEENIIEALLRKLIKETQKTNELLEKLLSRG